jgi:hypothetical protein
MCGPSAPTDSIVEMSVFYALDTELRATSATWGAGASEIEYLECGDGNWGKFAPEIVGADTQCLVCKETGQQLASM